MDHSFDTALQVLVADDGPEPLQGLHLSDDQRLGLFETLWDGLRRSPMEAAAEIRAAVDPGAEEAWREGNRRFDESGGETAELDLRLLSVKLARMVRIAGCDRVSAEFVPRRGSGPPAVRLCAVKDFGGGNVYRWAKEFMEAELIRMQGDLPKRAVDVFCHAVRLKFDEAEEALRHGKG
jgi:hypothetical protein